MNTPDEQDLIERLAAGDRSAFREFVERYKKMIYKLAYDMTQSHHDAEDVSQEVFAKVYRSFHTFRKDARLGSWLYRITVNTCRDFHRRAPRETAAGSSVSLSSEDPPAIEATAWEDDPEKAGAGVFLQARIDRALALVSERERAVFILRHYEELDLKSIAEILQISVGSAKIYLFRGLRKIRKELADFRGPAPTEVSYE